MTSKVFQLHHYKKPSGDIPAMTFGQLLKQLQDELKKNPWLNNIPVEVWDQHYGPDEDPDPLHTLSIYSEGLGIDERVVIGFNVEVELDDLTEDEKEEDITNS